MIRSFSSYATAASLALVAACGGTPSATMDSTDDGGGSGAPSSVPPAGPPAGGADAGGLSLADAGSGGPSTVDGGSYVDGGQDASNLHDAGSDDGGLDPNVAPGGNFDLSLWELQEPIGSAGSPTTISPAKLQGPSGFHDTYFFTDPTDGAMSFWDPENGVTTANSSYPRSELREMTAAGAPANWLPTGTNTLSATVKATLIPSHVAVGQIHLGTGTPSSTKPLLELFYFANGDVFLGIEQTPAGGNEIQNHVGNVPLGTKWSYVIGLSGHTISLVLDGGAVQTFPMSSTFDQEGMYFKAGDYDQSVGSSATIGAKVQFYALKIAHGP